MSDTVSYRPKTGEIPVAPGVYRFRDSANRILYVGKAKNLRARLSNYFAPLSSLHERTRRMVTTAASVEWTVVGSEFEALQLEFSWIKEFNPPFNVQFRDDKSYPFLAITLADDVPRVLITRNRSIPGARYFGPYTKVWAIRETLDLLLKVFPMRSCSDSVYRRAEQSGRPCLLGEIGKCAAPCVGRISKEDHKSIALDYASFMAGNDSTFIAELSDRMAAASAQLDYESAAKYRDQLSAIETVLSKNTIVLPETVDADLFGIAHDELAAAVQLFSVRGGRIRGVRSWVVDKELDLPEAELVETVVANAYTVGSGRRGDTGGDLVPPRLVVVPTLPADAAELERLLSELRIEHDRPGKVTMRVARRGDLAQLSETVTKNAQSALASYKTHRTADFVARSQALSDIQDALGMAEAPLRMECFDVSHLGGTNIVASMVVFEDGLPRKDLYRRFSIPDSTDDTESIFQTVSRRLARLEDPEPPPAEDGAARPRFAYRPNLLIVDGGQPQVEAARRAMRDAGVDTSGPGSIALCGIAKRLEEIWSPDTDYPVILPRNSDALFLFQRIRDEAHRFAISFQRQKRKSDLNSILSDIPGLGPARVRALLRHFGSVKRVREAGPEEIAAVKGIGPALAETVHGRLGQPNSAAP
ncbi:MAG: excinuclease ABC subunit UvrC [Micrococcales bacterium]|nr:excinuclease ABC subunit UvrC [Micrococcales bacterium]